MMLRLEIIRKNISVYTPEEQRLLQNHLGLQQSCFAGKREQERKAGEMK